MNGVHSLHFFHIFSNLKICNHVLIILEKFSSPRLRIYDAQKSYSATQKRRRILDRTRRLFYTYSALEKHSCRALRQNGGYRDRQKTDLIFTRTAGSRIFVRGHLPLRGAVAWSVGDFSICSAVRFSDGLQLLRPPPHSTGAAVCHSFLL
nr:MAG TPA_asm: hypothetical protein [Caudoviricetes sp.]